MPPFDPAFLDALKQMEDHEQDPGIVSKFLDAYGTHYIYRAHMGATYGAQSELLSESVKQLQSQQVSVEYAASASVLKLVSGQGSHGSAWQEKAVAAFESKLKQRDIYSVGSKPPKSGDALDWSRQSIQSPEAIEIFLDRIDKIPNLPLSAAAMSALTAGLDKRCSQLVSQREIEQCRPKDETRAPTPAPTRPYLIKKQNSIAKVRMPLKVIGGNMLNPATMKICFKVPCGKVRGWYQTRRSEYQISVLENEDENFMVKIWCTQAAPWNGDCDETTFVVDYDTDASSHTEIDKEEINEEFKRRR